MPVPYQFRKAVESVIKAMTDVIMSFGGLNVGTATEAGAGDARYSGDLEANRNSTYYTGYITIPLTAPLTSTSYDGDAYNNVAVTKIDTSVSFGAPAGIKGAFVKLTARDSAAWGTTGLYAAILPLTSSVLPPVEVWPAGGDVHVSNSGLVACDSNGDFCWTCNTSGGAVGATMDIWIEIHGYVI